jgi:hypothetical protein
MQKLGVCVGGGVGGGVEKGNQVKRTRQSTAGVEQKKTANIPPPPPACKESRCYLLSTATKQVERKNTPPKQHQSKKREPQMTHYTSRWVEGREKERERERDRKILKQR